MKKLLFLLLISIIAIGCKKDQNEKYDPKFGTKSNKTTLIEYLEKRDLAAPCEDIVVIKGTVVTTFPNFVQENNIYYASPTPDDQALCNQPKFYIDIAKILDDKKDYDKSFLASWLKKYGEFICYEETAEVIMCAHEITDEKHYEYVDKLCPVLDIMTLGQIKNRLDDESNEANYLAKDFYQQYMNFKFSTFGSNISFKLEPKYEEKGDYFSIPLFRSIVDKYQLNNGSSFEFLKADYYGVNNRIVFAITDSDNKRHFYDFSQIPPLGGTSVLYKSFSPL